MSNEYTSKIDNKTFTRAQIGQALECAYIESSELEEVIDNMLAMLAKASADARAEALEQAAKDLTHPMHGIIVCDEYCANRSCPDCIRIRAAKDAAEWLKQRAGKVR